jgi:hypothetical protein
LKLEQPLLKPRKFAELLLSRSAVCGVRRLGRGEVPENFCPSRNHNLTALLSFRKTHFNNNYIVYALISKHLISLKIISQCCGFVRWLFSLSIRIVGA